MNKKMIEKPIGFAIALMGMALWPATGQAALSPATASGWGMDDWNTSTLIPNTVNGGNNTPAIYVGANGTGCPWITTAMNAFCNTYTASYQWANPFANLASDLSVSDYAAWVVNPNANGNVNGFNLVNRASGDKGGATFGLTYTPKAGDPTSVIFIQAYQEILYGLNGNANPTINVKLDSTPNVGLPQYGGASSYTAGVSKMADRPFDSETDANPYPEGYHTDVQFQTVVAVYNGKINGDQNYTLYNYAEWWGYQYSNTDLAPVPEPSTCLAGVLMLVPFATGALRKLRSRMSE